MYRELHDEIRGIAKEERQKIIKEVTVKVIERLLEEDIDARDIAKIMSDTFICKALENGLNFELADSVEEFGEANSDNDLYEDDGDYESWGNFFYRFQEYGRI